MRKAKVKNTKGTDIRTISTKNEKYYFDGLLASPLNYEDEVIVGGDIFNCYMSEQNLTEISIIEVVNVKNGKAFINCDDIEFV
mgnify:CR=1 FL=1